MHKLSAKKNKKVRVQIEFDAYIHTYNESMSETYVCMYVHISVPLFMDGTCFIVSFKAFVISQKRFAINQHNNLVWAKNTKILHTLKRNAFKKKI